MLLILGIIASLMITPVNEGQYGSNFGVYMDGTVNWSGGIESWAIVTVTGQNEFSRTEIVNTSGDNYHIFLEYERNVGKFSPFTVSASITDGSAITIPQIRPDICWPDNFHLVLPYKYWSHIENFFF